MNLAARNLLQDKTRVLLSVAGVALTIMLILILTGFVSGMNAQVSRYLDQAPGFGRAGAGRDSRGEFGAVG